MGQAEIIEANTAEDYAVGRYLIEGYAAALGVDLCFQNFAECLTPAYEGYTSAP